MSRNNIIIVAIITGILIIIGGVWFWSRGNNFVITPTLGDEYQSYHNKNYGFSLEYPSGFEVEATDEGEGAATIVFRGGGEHDGFQVFISPYGEIDTLTRERILKDLPGTEINDSKEALIGPEKNVRALIFWSNSPDIGKTREVWFVHGDYLYEVTAYAEFDAELAKIMSTWKFQ